jgi:ankyrin repeat protein
LNSKLLTAAKQHQASRVKRLISRGAEIHCTDTYGRTPLHLAASDYHGNTIELLLQAGAKTDGEDHGRLTPTHVAASTFHGENRPRHVELLIQGGADVNHTNPCGWTPLYEACSQEIVEALLQAGANIHSRDMLGGTPLHRARSAQVAKALLLAGADVNSRDLKNATPLHFVWEQSELFVWQQPREGSEIELARVLVDAGADVDACADVGPEVDSSMLGVGREDVWTPLEWVQRQMPAWRCTYPSGPHRSRLANFHLRKADHAEIVSFLQGSSVEMMREKAEGEEKEVDSMC